MRNLLTIRNATSLHSQNITKQAKAIQRPEGCGTSCIDLGIFLNPNGDFGVSPLTFKGGQCYCIDSPNAASFLFAEGLTVEGYGVNGEYLGKKENAWGGSTGYFKITPSTDVSNVRYIVNYIKLNNPLEDYYGVQGVDWRHIAVFKDWDGTMKSEADIKDLLNRDVTGTIEQLHTFSAKVTVSYDTNDELVPDWNPDPDNLATLNPKKGTFSTKYANAYVTPEGFLQKLQTLTLENGEYSAESKIEVKIDETTGFYPNKVFQMKPNQIFDNNVEEYDFLSGGLSAGAIAGIVIACVVVVGVVVFCIVWFVVLKKGCCGKGGSADAEA